MEQVRSTRHASGRTRLSLLTSGALLVLGAIGMAAPSTAHAAAGDPTRGSQLYATTFDPSTFNQTVVGTSASLTQGPGPSLVCGVGSAGSKMIASVKQSISEPAAIWAEYDISLGSMNGQYVASFYFEGIGGNHRHLHIDFSNNTITLRDPNYNNEGPLVSVPGLNSGSTFHFVVVDTSPRYRVYVNGTQVIDFTDTFAASTPGGLGFDCASQNNGTGSDSVTNLSLYTVANTTCPSGWNCADIGSPTPAGSESLSGSTWTIAGGGSDITTTADHFHYDWQSFAADGSVSARIASQNNTNAWAKAGVMLRATTDTAAPYYGAFTTPGNGVTVQWRTTAGGGTGDVVVAGTAPLYLKVTRAGTTFTAYTSSNGTAWTLVPNSTHTITLSGALLAGLAVSSHNSSALSTVTADTVTISGPQPPTCPSGWSCADIGNPTPAGSESLSGSTWTIRGGGSDITTTADHFHYDWQSLAADGSVSAHLTSQSNSNAWAKAGVMLRATTDPASAYYAAFVTPGNGVTVQWRITTGGGTGDVVTTGTAPLYLKVTRTGTTFTASTSSDGTTWTLVPNSTHTISLSGALLAGLAVSSHNSSVLSTVTADTVSA